MRKRVPIQLQGVESSASRDTNPGIKRFWKALTMLLVRNAGKLVKGSPSICNWLSLGEGGNVAKQFPPPKRILEFS